MMKAALQITCAMVLIFLSQKAVSYAHDLYQKGKASESWVAVEARVETFEYRPSSHKAGGRHHGGGGQVGNPHFDVLYHYTYEGGDYSGDVTGFGPYSHGQLERPKRGHATVYVNPENPSESVYVKGVSKPNLAFLVLGVAMGVFGVFVGMLGLRNIVGRSRGLGSM